jgi:hypothetical protein
MDEIVVVLEDRSMYVDVDDREVLVLEMGLQGPPGPPGPQGPPGPGTGFYGVYPIPNYTTRAIINHDLGRRPIVQFISLWGEVIDGMDITVTENQVILEAESPFAGYAVLM